ncbi:elfless isoform b [Anaeramoeba flamelloides]|uniref:E3 ubiquitin protein ligase n=1 Tax=Anaeramoeba flamelloides TaxID=1746091 RepID=A0AAV7YH73_9EUKA|nr:elfless isoform b [Anaeramoeba flamelloides]
MIDETYLISQYRRNTLRKIIKENEQLDEKLKKTQQKYNYPTEQILTTRPFFQQLIINLSTQNFEISDFGRIRSLLIFERNSYRKKLENYKEQNVHFITVERDYLTKEINLLEQLTVEEEHKVRNLKHNFLEGTNISEFNIQYPIINKSIDETFEQSKQQISKMKNFFEQVIKLHNKTNNIQHDHLLQYFELIKLFLGSNFESTSINQDITIDNSKLENQLNTKFKLLNDTNYFSDAKKIFNSLIMNFKKLKNYNAKIKSHNFEIESFQNEIISISESIEQIDKGTMKFKQLLIDKIKKLISLLLNRIKNDEIMELLRRENQALIEKHKVYIKLTQDLNSFQTSTFQKWNVLEKIRQKISEMVILSQTQLNKTNQISEKMKIEQKQINGNLAIEIKGYEINLETYLLKINKLHEYQYQSHMLTEQKEIFEKRIKILQQNQQQQKIHQKRKQETDLMIRKNQLNYFVQSLTCSVCNINLKEEVLNNCGHSFCHNCIEKRLNNSKNCYTCNSKFSKKDVFPVFFA